MLGNYIKKINENQNYVFDKMSIIIKTSFILSLGLNAVFCWYCKYIFRIENIMSFYYLCFFFTFFVVFSCLYPPFIGFVLNKLNNKKIQKLVLSFEDPRWSTIKYTLLFCVIYHYFTTESVFLSVNHSLFFWFIFLISIFRVFFLYPFFLLSLLNKLTTSSMFVNSIISRHFHYTAYNSAGPEILGKLPPSVPVDTIIFLAAASTVVTGHTIYTAEKEEEKVGPVLVETEKRIDKIVKNVEDMQKKNNTALENTKSEIKEVMDAIQQQKQLDNIQQNSPNISEPLLSTSKNTEKVISLNEELEIRKNLARQFLDKKHTLAELKEKHTTLTDLNSQKNTLDRVKDSFDSSPNSFKNQVDDVSSTVITMEKSLNSKKLELENLELEKSEREIEEIAEAVVNITANSVIEHFVAFFYKILKLF